MKKLLFLSALTVAAGSALAQTAAFNGGNLIIVSVAPDSGFASNTACPVSLLEYPVAVGATVTQSLALPSTGSGTKFTNSASASSNLNLQFNGTYLTLGGYYAVSGTAGITGSSATAISRVAASVPVAGAV